MGPVAMSAWAANLASLAGLHWQMAARMLARDNPEWMHLVGESHRREGDRFAKIFRKNIGLSE
jgi:hypothetical protein